MLNYADFVDWLSYIHFTIIDWLSSPTIFMIISAIIFILIILLFIYMYGSWSYSESAVLPGFYSGDTEFMKLAEVDSLYIYIGVVDGAYTGTLTIDDSLYNFTIKKELFGLRAYFDGDLVDGSTDVMDVSYDIIGGYIKFTHNDEIFVLAYKNHEISNNIGIDTNNDEIVE